MSNFLTSLIPPPSEFNVVYKKLGELADYEQPTAYLVKDTKYKEDYPTPVLTAGKTFILGYTNETEGIYEASKHPTIIFDDFTTALRWVDFDFKAKSSAMKMITSKDENVCLLKYIYYWLCTVPSEVVVGDHKRQWISNYANKDFPHSPSLGASSHCGDSRQVRHLDQLHFRRIAPRNPTTQATIRILPRAVIRF